jgi:hypothetical protein
MKRFLARFATPIVVAAPLAIGQAAVTPSTVGAFGAGAR